MKSRSRPVVALVATFAIGCVSVLSPELSCSAEEGERVTRLQGTALIDRRERVIGAVVQVRPEDDPSKVYLTSTDEDGDFLVDALREGSYTLILGRSGFDTVVKKGVTLKFPFRAVVEVTMEPADDAMPAVERTVALETGTVLKISGSVTSREGEALSEVRIRMIHPDGELDPHAAQSGNDGRFTMRNITSGTWELEVDGVGYLPVDVVLDLTADTEINLLLVRQPADYEPSPIELMPPEKPTPPVGFEPKVYKEES